MFSESIGHGRSEFQPLEVVTICDHLVALRASQLEHEVAWEALSIPFDLLIELLRGDAVEGSKICVDQGLMAADNKNTPGNDQRRQCRSVVTAALDWNLLVLGPFRYRNADHGVAVDQSSEALLAPAFGAGRTHRQNEIAHVGGRIMHTYFDVRGNGKAKFP
jgi:hypothetical protein